MVNSKQMQKNNFQVVRSLDFDSGVKKKWDSNDFFVSRVKNCNPRQMSNVVKLQTINFKNFCDSRVIWLQFWFLNLESKESFDYGNKKWFQSQIVCNSILDSCRCYLKESFFFIDFDSNGLNKSVKVLLANCK